ncbi:MAG: hypothetical protein JSS76_13460 [Bacteroidetes bacterium]|nr:hypothetical protein [Bacteroidota bacterium]
MITIQHKARQFDLHVRFSTRWLDAIGRFIAGALDFSDVKSVRRSKEQMLRDFGFGRLPIH